MVGGVSESKASRVSLYSDPGKSRHIGSKRTSAWRAKKTRKLFSLGKAYSLAEAPPSAPGEPARSRTISQIESLRVDALSLRKAVLTLQCVHDPKKDRLPHITFGPTEITDLRLGRYPLRITVDTSSFNRHSTLDEFEKAFMAGRLSKTMSRTLAVNPRTGKLHRNASRYVVGSIVKTIEGDLPPGAEIEPNGYTINWPKFGRIVLGEVTMGPYIRRVTLLRLEHSHSEWASACSGGSFYP
jgi:hypothetical protein